MIPDPISTETTVQALKATLTLLASRAAPKVKEQILEWRTDSQAAKLQDNIRQIGKIITIASRTSSTIDEIYYPSKVKVGRSGARTVAFATEIFPGNSRISLILGTAGQGKSVFLRYLCLRELDLDGCIPLFVELRKIDKQTSLHQLLTDNLSSLGIGKLNAEEILKLLLKSGKTKIFLDGYDEISREFSLRTKSEITRITRDNEKTKILITSRPGAISQHLTDSVDIHQCEIAPISPSEHGRFFEKIGADIETKDRLLGAISRSKAEIKDLLSTPLMLTLLVKTCGAQQDLPDTLPEFYDSLFNVLSSTHDGTKPGYVREKATNLGNAELEKLFCAFCFASKELFKKTSLSVRQLEESFQSASKITDIKSSLEGFKTDVTETICLMVKDGLDTTFIHKSIQEYYSARFIHQLEDKEQASAILKSIEANTIFDWIGEIQFLEDFKDRTYENSMGIPHAKQLIDSLCLKSKTAQQAISNQKLRRLLGKSGISISRSKETKEIRIVSWRADLKSINNRYSLNLTAGIAGEIIRTRAKTTRPDSISDSLQVVQITSLLTEDEDLFNTVKLFTQKYCDSLARQKQAMEGRQSRQAAGLLALLKKSS
jgi:NACHT domain